MDTRNIARNELILRKVLNKAFKKQAKYLENNWEKLRSRPKDVENDLKNMQKETTDETLVLKAIPEWEALAEFWLAMGVYSMIEDMYPQINKTTLIGYTRSYSASKPKLLEYWVVFDKANPLAYQELFGDLQLSNYKGSISRTTKENVLLVIQDWIQNNLTPWELSKNITGLNEVLFSKARSEMIAVTELGKSYEYWNYLPMKEAQAQWAEVIKRWNTVNDSRVRPEHAAAENEWRVPYDYIYPWLGQWFPPAGVRCRCTIDNDIK